MDWTSLFFEAPQQGIVRVGYSRDHRPDRPQATIGLSMDRESGMPIGLTVNAGTYWMSRISRTPSNRSSIFCRRVR